MRNLALLALVAASGCKIEQQIVSSKDNVGIGQPPPVNNPVQTDRIVQVSRPSVDILFVIDNSCSMLEEQSNLAQNFPAFLQYFLTSGLDYHIGVVSTDLEDPDDSGKLQRAFGFNYIDENTPNPEAVFASMVQLGNGGWSVERGRDAVYTALELRRDGERNLGFYRDGAALDVIFVSDEDDQSVLISPAEFRQWFTLLKWSPDQATAHSIVELGVECEEATDTGSFYLEYAAYTGGAQFSICENDWEPMLETLGIEASGLLREYFLSKIPVLETLEVNVIEPNELGEDVTIGFNVCAAGQEVVDLDCEVVFNASRNSIVFLEFIPDPLTEVIATYNILENYAATPAVEEGLD
ncbi:MAG: VWA domain-containing protein [Myxococcota bacterium]